MTGSVTVTCDGCLNVDRFAETGILVYRVHEHPGSFTLLVEVVGAPASDGSPGQRVIDTLIVRSGDTMRLEIGNQP